MFGVFGLPTPTQVFGGDLLLALLQAAVRAVPEQFNGREQVAQLSLFRVRHTRPAPLCDAKQVKGGVALRARPHRIGGADRVTTHQT